jgi:hypothetical protein
MRFQLLAMFDDKLPGKTILTRGLRRVGVLAGFASPFSKVVVSGIEGILKTYGYKDLELLERIDAKKLKDLVGTVRWEDVPGAEDVLQNLHSINDDIERWFELAKNGFQELYERRIRVWSFWTSLVVVVILNANLFDLYRQFSSDTALRDAVVARTEQAFSSGKITTTTTATALPSDSAMTDSIMQEVRLIQDVLKSEGFQLLGWNVKTIKPSQTESWVGHWFMNILGWLAMALLVSLGAPFWYDVLRTMFGIKNALGNRKKTPGDSDDQSQTTCRTEPGTPGIPSVG